MIKKRIAAALCGFMFLMISPFSAAAGEWDLSEDGKYWTYCESPGNPIEDEWIEDNGKIYYVDTKGRMKTGWVTNQDNGNKYYMGEDGAMCFNTFSDDDRYVGSEGTQVQAYDTYRKKVKAELKKATKKKSTRTTRKTAQSAASTAAEERQPYFLMTDLNLDGYLDLVVMEGTEESKSPLMIAIWDWEEETFQLSAEFDEAGENSPEAVLYRDPEGETVWLELSEKNGDFSLFQMEDQDVLFRNIWTFTMETDDWGGPEYHVNGVVLDPEEWEQDLAEARQARGDAPLSGYLPATEENIKAQVDRVLTEEELELWERGDND